MKEEIEKMLQEKFKYQWSSHTAWRNQDVILAILEAKNLPQALVSKSLTPHRCPICGGNGLVSGAFYTSLLGCGGTSTNVTDKCRQCDGQGILWG